MTKQKTTPEMRKKRELGSRLWLEYYNRTLYEKGLITRQERSRMSLKISAWQGPST